MIPASFSPSCLFYLFKARPGDNPSLLSPSCGSLSVLCLFLFFSYMPKCRGVSFTVALSRKRINASTLSFFLRVVGLLRRVLLLSRASVQKSGPVAGNGSGMCKRHQKLGLCPLALLGTHTPKRGRRSFFSNKECPCRCLFFFAQAPRGNKCLKKRESQRKAARTLLGVRVERPLCACHGKGPSVVSCAPGLIPPPVLSPSFLAGFLVLFFSCKAREDTL